MQKGEINMHNYTHNYPSDISREEFEIIRTMLENAKKRTKPRKIDIYDVFCAILYILKGGVQWRMLPNDFPKWTTVYFYFQIWAKPQETGFSILEDALKKIGQPNTFARFTSRNNQFLHR